MTETGVLVLVLSCQHEEAVPMDEEAVLQSAPGEEWVCEQCGGEKRTVQDRGYRAHGSGE